jgi:putative hydrolase of the HAD superfamily
VRKGVVFDLFGTLVPKWNFRRGDDVKATMAQCLGLPTSGFLQAWGQTFWDRELGRNSIEESLQRIADLLSCRVTNSAIQEARLQWYELIGESLNPRDSADVATLRAIRQKGFKIGVISNCGPEVPSLFGRSPLAELVDHVTLSSVVGIAKPDRRMYESHCTALGINPQQSIYVGDGGNDELNGASAVGFRAFLLRISEEIDREGLPEHAESWQGEELLSLKELLEVLDRA